MRYIVLALLLILSLLGCREMGMENQYGTVAVVTPPEVQYIWAPPDSGSAVITYEVEAAYGTTDTVRTIVPQEVVSLPTHAGLTLRVRVRGRDAEGRYGPWSEWSEPYYMKGRIDMEETP